MPPSTTQAIAPFWTSGSVVETTVVPGVAVVELPGVTPVTLAVVVLLPGSAVVLTGVAVVVLPPGVDVVVSTVVVVVEEFAARVVVTGLTTSIQPFLPSTSFVRS